MPPILQAAVLTKSNADKIPSLLAKERPVEHEDEANDIVEGDTLAANTAPEELAKPIVCEGYDFNKGIDYDALLKSYATVGLQAMNFGAAVEQVKKMVSFLILLINSFS